jgi:hypothetical protein
MINQNYIDDVYGMSLSTGGMPFDHLVTKISSLPLSGYFRVSQVCFLPEAVAHRPSGRNPASFFLSLEKQNVNTHILLRILTYTFNMFAPLIKQSNAANLKAQKK